MCLAKAYLNKQDNEPVLQDIAYMRLYDGQVELETLLGKGKVIQGRVVVVKCNRYGRKTPDTGRYEYVGQTLNAQ